MMDIISELQRRKNDYLERYKGLYTQYCLAEKLSDEARGRYIGRMTELSYILIDIFGMTGRELQDREEMIRHWIATDTKGGKEDE